MRMKFFWNTVFVFFLIGGHSFGQSSAGQSFQGSQKQKKKKVYTAIAAGLNANSYFGDLNAFQFQKLFQVAQYKPGVTFSIDNRISARTAVAVELSWNRIGADDFYARNNDGRMHHYTRNLSFRNDLLELSAVARYHFVKNDFSYAERPDFSPYLLAGAGLFHNDPKARTPEFFTDGSRHPDAGRWRSLRPLGTEGQFTEGATQSPYSAVQPVALLGLGAAFKINRNFSINLEVCYRFIFTDYLDDVSGNYVDLGAFDSELAKIFSDRSAEVNSSNGRNPRNFVQIGQFTGQKSYQSDYDGRLYQVWDGYGEANRKRGDDSAFDKYVTAGIRVSYILSGQKEKR